MKKFNRMNKKAWEVFSRAIRTKKGESSYFCGRAFDARQWVLIYVQGQGIEILPLYEHKDSYIRCCRILYQLASNEQQRNQYMQEAKEWASRKA